MPLLAGVGVLGGLLRDLAPDPEEIWRFSPVLRSEHLPLLQGEPEPPAHRLPPALLRRSSWSPKFLRQALGQPFGRRRLLLPAPGPAAIR